MERAPSRERPRIARHRVGRWSSGSLVGEDVVTLGAALRSRPYDRPIRAEGRDLMTAEPATTRVRGTGRLRSRFLTAIFVVPSLWLAVASPATAAVRADTLPANICTAIGASKAVAVKFFGKGAYAVNVTQYSPPTCDIDGPRDGQLVSPSGLSTAGNVWVVLTAKTPTMSTMAEYVKYDIHYPGTALSGLGAGALFVRVGNDPYIYFDAGPYFVEDFDAAGGGTYPISTYVPESELLGFARYIYARLN
jgi:hypothetical protein